MASRRGKKNLTEAQIRTFLDLVSKGMYPARAARKIGVTPHAMMMRRDRDREFDELVEMAEAAAEHHLVSIVWNWGPKDWRAAMGMLERRWPERWARPEIRADLTTVNINTDDLVKGIHAGLDALAARHAPKDAPDVDGPEPDQEPAAPDPPASSVTRS